MHRFLVSRVTSRVRPRSAGCRDCHDGAPATTASTSPPAAPRNSFARLFVRGFELERLFFDLLHFTEFEYTKPYRTLDGEQVDGHFKYEKFDYLVEVKWTAEPTKQKDLSIFDGKIRGKAQSTRGFFLAANGFDNNAVDKFSGDAPRIVLMTGEDLAIVVDGTLPFFDLMKAKVDAIVRYGNINFPARDARGFR